jgi:hypothetical protein
MAAINAISTTTIGIRTITQASSLKGFFIATYLVEEMVEILTYPVSEAKVQ